MDCQGKCPKHSGTVKPVIVYGSGWSVLHRHFCEAAIVRERENGLEVVADRTGHSPLYAFEHGIEAL